MSKPKMKEIIIDMRTGKIVEKDLPVQMKGDVEVFDPMQMLHDCPECRAAMAAGEQPVIRAGEELEELMKAYLRGEPPPATPRPGRRRS
jgi:hypothetical protein